MFDPIDPNDRAWVENSSNSRRKAGTESVCIAGKLNKSSDGA